MSLNKAMLIGRLGHPPSMKQSNSGLAICEFSLATDHHTKDGKETTWHRVVCFGKTAEACEKYIDKGSLVYVEGRIENDTYEKDGIKRHVSRVIADQVRFLNGKSDKPETSSESQGVSYEDDNIPF